MKKLLLFAFLSFTFYQINAQCTVNANNFGNNQSVPDYNVAGDISVTLEKENTVTVNFASNFSTASGPDVRLYLIKSEGRTLNQLKELNPTNLESISFGLIGFSGAQSFTQTIPSTLNIEEYDTVFFYCLQFNAFWDIGSYTAFTTSTCSVLSTVDTVVLDNIGIYPNPAINIINITNPSNVGGNITLFNVLGKQVLQTKMTQNPIDISNFNSGIYLLKIDVNGTSKTQRLVIQ